MPASYPRGEGGFGISLPTALLSFPACLSAWIPTAPALTVPGGMGRWLSRSQSRTGTLGHRARGGHMPARGLALLGELWHPVGATGGASPLVAVSPRCAWLGSQGRVAGQPRNSGTHLASIVPWEPVLQLVPSHPSGACPGRSWGSGVLPPSLPSAPSWGCPGHGWAGERGRQMLEGLSPPLIGPLTSRPILELPSPGCGSIPGAAAPALPCVPSWEGSGEPVLLQDSTAQTPVGQGPPAPRWGFPKASSQGPAPGCGCFSPGCAGVWGCSAGSARAGLG